MLRLKKIIYPIVIFPCLVVSFQNCSGGFTPASLAPTISDGGASLAASELLILKPASQSVSQGQVQLEGSCSANVSVEIAGDIEIASSIPCNGNAFSTLVNLSAGDGLKNVRLNQRDYLGNLKQDSRSFIKDTVAPLVAVVTPAQNALVNAAPVVSGNCESGVPVLFKIGADVQTTTCAGGMFAATLNLSAIADGDLSMEISQTDAARLKSSVVRTLRKDTVAPNVTIASPANNATVTSPITLAGSCETGVDVVIAGSGVKTPLTMSCVGGAFSVSVPLIDGAGARVVTAAQTDGVGNKKTDTKNYTAQVPTVPPLAINITAPAANSMAKAGVTLTGACVSGVTVVISGSGVAASTNATCTSGAFSAAITFSSGEGAKVVQVSQNNGVASGSDTRSFFKDSVAPTLTIAAPAADTSSQMGVTLNGTCESGLNVGISGTGVAVASAACANGIYVANLTFSSGDGAKAVTLTQTDAAGNVATVSRNFVRDTTAPLLAFSSPAAGFSAATGVTITGTCESGLMVNAAGTGVKANASAACASAAFSIVLTFSDNDGSKLVEISQTDAAGNTARQERSFTRATPAVVYDGVALYSQNCAGCHGALASSGKKDRSAAQISTAIGNVSAMSSLAGLNGGQVQAIADALKTAPANACLADTNRGSSRTGVDRLTGFELEASTAALLPATKTKLGTAWASLFTSMPDAPEMMDVKNFVPNFSTEQLSAWLNIADQLGTGISTADIDACLSVTAPAQTCYRQAITGWFKKVWRRPLATTEVDEVMAQISGLSKTDAVTRLVTAALISPRFMFRIESSANVVGSRTKVDAYAVASRISFATLGTGPDATLMDAADKNELQTIARVEAQVKRLLQTAQAKTKFDDFVRSWMGFSKLSNSATDYPVISGNLNPDHLKTEATTKEVLEYVRHVVWNENGSFQSLMSRPIALARNTSMATIYGSTANADNVATPTAYPAPNHPGLALRAAFLISGSQFSSPIRRGVFVLQRLLCSEIPLPSAEILAMRDNAAAGVNPVTVPNHENVRLRTSGTTCLSCHSKINPTGYTFENFDALGRVQSQQSVIDLKTGAVLATHNLPPASMIPVDLGVGASSFGSGQALAQALSQSPATRSCMNKLLFRHLDRRTETAADSCRMNESLGILDQGRPVLESLTKTIANDDIFWRGAN